MKLFVVQLEQAKCCGRDDRVIIASGKQTQASSNLTSGKGEKKTPSAQLLSAGIQYQVKNGLDISIDTDNLVTYKALCLSRPKINFYQAKSRSSECILEVITFNFLIQVKIKS